MYVCVSVCVRECVRAFVLVCVCVRMCARVSVDPSILCARIRGPKGGKQRDSDTLTSMMRPNGKKHTILWR